MGTRENGTQERQKLASPEGGRRELLRPLPGYPQLNYVNQYYVTLKIPPLLAGKETIMTNIEITTEFIKLQDLLKFANVVGSGGEAKIIIQEGEVMVNGEVCTQRGKKIRPGDTVELGDLQLTVSYAD